MEDIIYFKNVEYYKAECILKNAQIFSKGCRNGRELIKKKNIDDKNYIFVIGDENKWKLTDGNNKRLDKLLLRRDWVLENIPEYNQNKKEELNMAPPTIHLEDHEKFQDNDGNILDIQVIGEREHNKCYFRVKDISEGFKMGSLERNIKDKKSGFKIEEEFKYFNCRKDDNKITREMFLTFGGFKRLIETSKINKFNNNTKMVLHNWLKQFDKKKCIKFIINNNNYEKMKNGYVYLITSDIINFVKIGFWKSTIYSLKSRYITTYGKDLSIFYVDTKDASLLEKQCHMHFKNKRITNELFIKDFYDEYKNYLMENKQDYEKNMDHDKDIEFINDSMNDIRIIENYDYYYDQQFLIFDDITIIYDSETYYVKIEDIRNNIGDINITDYSDTAITFDKRELYLTYTGLLRVLFASHSKTASKFINWAAKTLFTAQMGTENQRNKLVADIKEVL